MKRPTTRTLTTLATGLSLFTATWQGAAQEAASAPEAEAPKKSLPWVSADSKYGVRIRQWYDNVEDPDPQACDAAEALVAQGNYGDALGSLKRLKRWYKDKPREEDILYLLGECYYQRKDYPEAQDVFAELLKKYPTTRHLPNAIQRTYDIAYYWLEDARRKSQGQPPVHGAVSRTVNLFDRSRPMLDTEGRALEAIQTIQQYDPLGPLTDDAMMMAGAQQFVTGRFIRAAGSYEQIAVDQPRSEHAPKALVLAAQSNLRAYSGPNYDSQDLDAAERNVRAAIARGADLPIEQRQQLEEDLQLIRREKAHRDYSTAVYFERLRKTTAAAFYYKLVTDEHRDSEWAAQAEVALARLEGRQPNAGPANPSPPPAPANPPEAAVAASEAEKQSRLAFFRRKAKNEAGSDPNGIGSQESLPPTGPAGAVGQPVSQAVANNEPGAGQVQQVSGNRATNVPNLPPFEPAKRGLIGP